MAQPAPGGTAPGRDPHRKATEAGTDRGRPRLAGFALAGVLLAGIGMALHARMEPSLRVGAKVGCRAPGFALRALGRQEQLISLRDLGGRPTVLFFSCGCAACTNCAIALAAVAPRLRGAQMVGIMVNPGTYGTRWIRDFREATGFHWPLLMDSDARATRAYHSVPCPRVWLVDPAGIVRYCNQDSDEAPGEIARELTEAYYRQEPPVR